MQRAPCLRPTSAPKAECGGARVVGCSPCGSQRTLGAPHPGWRGTASAVGRLLLQSSILKSKCLCAVSSVGCPSCGGQRSRGGDSTATVGRGSKVGTVSKHRRGLARHKAIALIG